MRVIRFLIALPLTLVVLAFSVANRQEVTIDLWPLERSETLPLYLLVLAAILIGFILGALGMWMRDGRVREKARRYHFKADSLERELAQSKQRQAQAEAKVEEAAKVSAGVALPAPAQVR